MIFIFKEILQKYPDTFLESFSTVFFLNNTYIILIFEVKSFSELHAVQLWKFGMSLKVGRTYFNCQA